MPMVSYGTIGAGLGALGDAVAAQGGAQAQAAGRYLQAAGLYVEGIQGAVKQIGKHNYGWVCRRRHNCLRPSARDYGSRSASGNARGTSTGGGRTNRGRPSRRVVLLRSRSVQSCCGSTYRKERSQTFC